jgi:hypothetical protein
MQPPPPQWPQGPYAPPASPAPYVPAVPNAPADPAQPGSVSAVEAIKFIFSDEDWKNNLLLAAVHMFIPIVGPIALHGWYAEIFQRLTRRHPRPIPKLDFADLGHYIQRGMAAFVASLVMSLPFGFIVGLLSAVLYGGGIALAATFKEPIIILPVLLALFLLFFLFGVGFSVFMHASMTWAELTEDVGRSITPRNLLSYAGKTWTTTLVASLVYGIISIPLIMVGYAMCFIGMYPAIVVMLVGMTHLRWQIYQQYLTKGGEPLPIKAPVTLPSEARWGPAPTAPQPPYRGA